MFENSFARPPPGEGQGTRSRGCRLLHGAFGQQLLDVGVFQAVGVTAARVLDRARGALGRGDKTHRRWGRVGLK